MAKRTILTYTQVKERLGSGRCHLLLGNGFSIACNRVYAYGRLYDFAKKNGLTKHVQGVFEYLGTNNFEGVMKLLKDGVWLAKHYGLRAGLRSKADMAQDLESVKVALVEALAKTHLQIPGEVGEDRLKRCREFMKPYHNIFTVNYDLLLYWVTMSEQEMSRRDGFRDSTDDPEAKYCVFCEHIGGDKGIFFIHGALHLYVDSGEVRKHTWKKTGRRLIELVREGLTGREYPLFVAEGAAEKKKIQIQGDSYLSYCLGKLQRIQGPLVTFGLSLGESDQHVLDSISNNCALPTVYVGLHGDPDSRENGRIRDRCLELESRRKTILAKNRSGKELTVRFYDSASAPVWDPTTG
jgi:hypothetical protein